MAFLSPFLRPLRFPPLSCGCSDAALWRLSIVGVLSGHRFRFRRHLRLLRRFQFWPRGLIRQLLHFLIHFRPSLEHGLRVRLGEVRGGLICFRSSLGRWNLVIHRLAQLQVRLGRVWVQRIGRFKLQVSEGGRQPLQASLGHALRLDQAGVSHSLLLLGDLVLQFLFRFCHGVMSSYHLLLGGSIHR